MPRDAGGNFRLSGLRPNPKDGKLPVGKAPQRQQQQQGADAHDGAGEGEDGVMTHEIHQHPDGHLVTRMHDGTETEHPDHLHMMAHVGHHITGGDGHHVLHRDGVSVRGHSIQESGEHSETQEHNTAEEAKDAVGKFFDEEASEPAHEHDGGGGGGYDGGMSGGLGGFGG